MFPSVHRCPDTTCAFGRFTGSRPYSFEEGHPSFSEEGFFNGFTLNLTGKTVDWLEANRTLLQQGDEYTKDCLERIKVAVAKEQKCVKTIDSILGRLNVWISFGSKMMTVKCRDFEVSFPAQLFAPFFKDPAEAFFLYKKEIVDLFISIAEGVPLNLPLGDAARQLASVCLEMNYPELHQIIWEQIVLRADKEELARIVINVPEQRNTVVTCCPFSSVNDLNDEAISSFQAVHIEMFCNRLNLRVSEKEVFDFVIRWMKLHREKIDIERCVYFENADFKWFDETFVISEEHQNLMTRPKVIAWSSFLDPHVKGTLPIEKKRGTRDAAKDFEGKKTLNVLEKWYATRMRRIKDCIVLKSNHLVDSRLFKKEWMKVSFDDCTDDAIEDFIYILYKMPIEFRSFQTAKLLKDCGLTEECECWITKRVAQDRAKKTELSWLQTLPEGIEIPEVIIDILCCNLLDRAKNIELLKSVSASQLQRLLGKYKIWAMPVQLWGVIQNYITKYQTDEEKKAFFADLEKALEYKSCPKFCNLLKEKEVLSQETWFRLNAIRARIKNYAKVPDIKGTQVSIKVALTAPGVYDFIVSNDGIECTFALSVNPVDRTQSDARHKQYRLQCNLKYIEGPPCTIAFNGIVVGRISMTEGMETALPACMVDSYGYGSDYKPSMGFSVFKKHDSN